jgi:hypothetical protein
MKLLEYMDLTDLVHKSEVNRAKYLCYYLYKETGQQEFSMKDMLELLEQCGFNTPNISRLKANLTTGSSKVMRIRNDGETTLTFIAAIMQRMEKDLGSFWLDNECIESNSDLIDEVKFYGKRGFLDKLIIQINNTYANHCYDACAVLMRRLFEVLLVLMYQEYGIDEEIKDPSGLGYLMLDKIVTNVIANKVLNLSRIKKEYDTFRQVGNFSAHSITYTAGKKDIDDIKLNYRVMLEELYTKAGLIK